MGSHNSKKIGNYDAHHSSLFIIRTVFFEGGWGRNMNDLLNHDSWTQEHFEVFCGAGARQSCPIHISSLGSSITKGKSRALRVKWRLEALCGV